MKVLQLNINKDLDKALGDAAWRWASLFYPAMYGRWFWQLFPFMFSLNKQFLEIFAPDHDANNMSSVKKGIVFFVESLIPYGVVRGTGFRNVRDEVFFLGLRASHDWETLEEKDGYIFKRSRAIPALEQHISVEYNDGVDVAEDHNPGDDLKSMTITFKVGKDVWSEYTFTNKLMPFNDVYYYIQDCLMGNMIHRTWHLIERFGKYMDDDGNLLPEELKENMTKD